MLLAPQVLGRFASAPSNSIGGRASLPPFFVHALLSMNSRSRFINSRQVRSAKSVLMCRSYSAPIYAGFSLIELVIVIAILGILVSIALPAFRGIQKEAQTSQVKSALSTIIKECLVAETREKPTNLGSIQSAQASLSGYTLGIESGYQQGSSQYAAAECFTNFINPITSQAVYGTYLLGNPVQNLPGKLYQATPQFWIIYNQRTGSTTNVCQYWYGDSKVDPSGCQAPAPSPCIPPPGSPPGYCPPSGQGWTRGQW